ncbi:MAG: Flp pilus assembly protein CpaB [Candidatus Omnitrophica bacterium]|nr:Flp pilus assembly protein CpaB [Candidatus Omnitrophota bacterium]
MAMENRRQVLLIVFAVAAGIIAVVLMGVHVQKQIGVETNRLSEDYEAKQKEMVAQIRQDSDQKMAALAQELERVKTEQAEVVKKQVAALQQQMGQKGPAGEKRRSKTSLAYKTPEGKRAVTVMIDSLSAVGGLLNAGDFVDVIAHLNVPVSGYVSGPEAKKNNNTVTAMIFQDLQVLAVNTNLDEPGYYDEQQTVPSLKVTFAVDPQEAGLLAFANINGKLELALRSPNEREHQMVKASTWKTLADYVLQNQGANIRVPDGAGGAADPQAEKPYIQIFKGGKEL